VSVTTRVVRRARRKGVKVLSRRQWGSRAAKTYLRRRLLTRGGKYGKFVRRADTVVQHITVTKPSGDFRADCRTVERIGLDRFGSGVSYNFLVDMRTGAVAVGQPLDAKGTHTVNDKGVRGYSKDQNLAARAIAVVGMPNTPLSTAAERSIGLLLKAMVEAKAITPTFDYLPHSKFASKDCPCDATRSRMTAIRKSLGAARR